MAHAIDRNMNTIETLRTEYETTRRAAALAEWTFDQDVIRPLRLVSDRAEAEYKAAILKAFPGSLQY